jgi:hypothetical protein
MIRSALLLSTQTNQTNIGQTSADFNILHVVVIKRLKALIKIIRKYWSIIDYSTDGDYAVFECGPYRINVRIIIYNVRRQRRWPLLYSFTAHYISQVQKLDNLVALGCRLITSTGAKRQIVRDLLVLVCRTPKSIDSLLD